MDKQVEILACTEREREWEKGEDGKEQPIW